MPCAFPVVGETRFALDMRLLGCGLLGGGCNGGFLQRFHCPDVVDEANGALRCDLSMDLLIDDNDRANPQAPRQATVSTVNIMSGVVLFFSLVPSVLCKASRMGRDCLTWQAVPSQTRMTCLPLGSRAKWA